MNARNYRVERKTGRHVMNQLYKTRMASKEEIETDLKCLQVQGTAKNFSMSSVT